MNYINSEAIGFFIYNDMSVGNISYEMNIYKNDLLIRTDQIVLDTNEYEGNEFVIDELSPNTTYAFECIATYTNPQTLRQEQDIIYQEEITTLDVYTYSYSVETFNDYIEVTIILNDPNNYFQNAYYESYDTSGDYDIYLDSEIYLFNDNGNDKSVTFTIFIPTTSAYQITIDIRSQFDYSVKQIIDIIIFE